MSVRAAYECGLAIAIAASLSACALPQGQTGHASLLAPQSASRAASGRSWVLPEAKSENLLYVSTPYYGIFVFSYPRGKMVGLVYDHVSSPQGMCVDKKGDLFVADAVEGVVEFAHGGTEPIAILKDHQESVFAPYDCSIDPTTGNLAATNSDSTDVAVYRKAQGRPQNFSDPNAIMAWCTFDGSGNLYVDQIRSKPGGGVSGRLIGELPKGESQFTNIRLSKALGAPGGLEWDGKYVTVGDVLSPTVYRVRVAAKDGTITGHTQLSGAKQVLKYWIQGAVLVGPDHSSGSVGFWHYPAGGESFNAILGFEEPLAAAVSLAK